MTILNNERKLISFGICFYLVIPIQTFSKNMEYKYWPYKTHKMGLMKHTK